MLIVLITTAITISLTAIYVLATQTESEVVTDALAGETTMADAQAAAETLATGRYATTTNPTPTEWQVTTVSSLTDAEDLLDMLENQGHTERELVVLGNCCFAVRWR